jgi:hypothetical protein
MNHAVTEQSADRGSADPDVVVAPVYRRSSRAISRPSMIASGRGGQPGT